jgi:hypothetical protein
MQVYIYLFANVCDYTSIYVLKESLASNSDD